MRSTLGAVPVALAAAIPGRPDPTLGWWDTGHQIIAQVATEPGRPATREGGSASGEGTERCIPLTSPGFSLDERPARAAHSVHNR